MTVGGNIPLRVVIDTSILVPILTYEFPSTNWLVRMWQSRLIEPLICDETLDELEEKLLEKSPTTKEYPARKFVERALRQYTPWCKIIPPQDAGGNPLCEDETDQKFIDLACAGTAEVLITRDDKLLSMVHATAFLITNDRDFRNMTSQEHSTSLPPNTVEGEDTRQDRPFVPRGEKHKGEKEYDEHRPTGRKHLTSCRGHHPEGADNPGHQTPGGNPCRDRPR